jgi:glycosyltransferase involved in cell wall biosynthesis
MNFPLVSVIIPCRNEAKFISECLNSVAAQDYQKDKIEVLVIDGMSEDGTREVIKNHIMKETGIIMLDNLDRIVPTALNIGVKKAQGDVIIRMDAHSVYEREYISKCVKYLQKFKSDNIGGIWVTKPGSDSLVARSIALALSHPFGAGNAYYRIGTNEPKYVDTVPGGCYKREVFKKIGLFDEDLIRNQDDEFNLRLIKNGGKILLVPEIVSYYYARDSLSKLSKMYFQYGYFKPLVALKIGAVLTWRQLIPFFFVSSLVLSFLLSVIFRPLILIFFFIVLAYLLVNSAFSFSIAIRKGLKYLMMLPAVFSAIHISYGVGYLKGIWDFVILKKYRRKEIADIPLTR